MARNPKPTAYALSYQGALRRYLDIGSPRNLQAAINLGRRAVALGLDTLDLAAIHEHALLARILPEGSRVRHDRFVKSAKRFFARSLVPMEETHRSALEDNARLDQLIRKLQRRTQDLATSNRALKKEVVRRKRAETTLLSSERQSYELLEEAQGRQKQLRLLSRRILTVQEDERKRISRELHDVIAQMLTGINFRLAALKTEALVSSKGISKKITQTQRLVEKSVDIVHRFARELRPAVLDDLGLVPALFSFAKTYTEETGIPVAITSYEGVEHLSIPRRTALYRVAHEALTNAARHSRATRVSISIRRLHGAIGMTIRDNGKGFDMTKVPVRRRLGLLGIRERVEMVGGTLAITSAPGKGMDLRVLFPHSTGSKERPS